MTRLDRCCINIAFVGECMIRLLYRCEHTETRSIEKEVSLLVNLTLVL